MFLRKPGVDNSGAWKPVALPQILGPLEKKLDGAPVGQQVQPQLQYVSDPLKAMHK